MIIRGIGDPYSGGVFLILIRFLNDLQDAIN